jgi:hypothetical protein
MLDYDGLNTPTTWVTPYRDHFGALGASILAAHMMGLKEYWNNDALFDYMDRYIYNQRKFSGEYRTQFPTAGPSYPWIDRMWDAYRPSLDCYYMSFDSATKKSTYNCTNQIFNCNVVTQCSDYAGNDLACSSDPCNLDCNGNCQSSGMCQLTSAYWDIT